MQVALVGVKTRKDQITQLLCRGLHNVAMECLTKGNIYLRVKIEVNLDTLTGFKIVFHEALWFHRGEQRERDVDIINRQGSSAFTLQ